MDEEIVVARGPKILSPEEAKLVIENIPVIRAILEYRRNNVS